MMTVPPVYELACIDCGFHQNVVDEFTTVIDEIEAHQAETEDDSRLHFVTVHRRS